jgi:hypothetical protein
MTENDQPESDPMTENQPEPGATAAKPSKLTPSRKNRSQDNQDHNFGDTSIIGGREHVWVGHWQLSTNERRKVVAKARNAAAIRSQAFRR